LETLPQLLFRTELEAAGISITFVHRARKYTNEVECDNGTATTAEARCRFLAAVDADDKATGILLFGRLALDSKALVRFVAVVSVAFIFRKIGMRELPMALISTDFLKGTWITLAVPFSILRFNASGQYEERAAGFRMGLSKST
jgi:hypothetical protein